MKFSLQVKGAKGAGSKEFEAGKPVRIGRDPANDLVLDDPEVSRFHAEIRFANGTFVLADLGSRNGTSIRGKKIKESPLSDGMEFSIHDTPVHFSTAGTVTSASPEKSNTAPPSSKRLILLAATAALILVYFLIPEPSRVKPKDSPAVAPSPVSSTIPQPGPAPAARVSEAEAMKSLEYGRKMIEDWRIEPSNLYKGVQALAVAEAGLSAVPGRKAQAEETSIRLSEAREKLESEFRARKFEAEKAVKLGDRIAAENELNTILAMIPDQRDERNRYARERMRSILPR
jgi:pSer/pThr/pTyr-binding forkhead associated (FHA) protein